MRRHEQRRIHPGLRVGVVGVEQRVTVRIVVRCELGLDVRQRDVAPHAKVQPLHHEGNVDVGIDHNGVIPFAVVYR